MNLELHPALAETGRFKLQHCLGMGAFGVVYEVFDKEQSANVALKWLRNSDASTIARFKREFRALADLVHPNLVGFRDLITVAGEWFFTMDLVSGIELLSWVRPASPASLVNSKMETHTDGFGSTVLANNAKQPASKKASVAPPPPSSVLKGSNVEQDAISRPLTVADLPRLRATLEQLAAGLNVLHNAGMLHRDVKPSNVLVRHDGRVVLLDFGLVADLGTDGVAQSMTGQIVGTPGYMSPEQASGSPIGPPSDWYAVGVILFQALTGKLPFDGDPHSVLLRKQMSDAPSPHLLVRGVPRALSELCVDLLHRAPERRPNGVEFLDRLRTAIPSGAHGSASISVASFGPQQAERGGVAGHGHHVKFVGREAHLWGLDEALQEVDRNKTVIALVHGRSGMGKSALVRCFLDVVRAERPDTIILEGRCYERESMPYRALDSLVDSLCRYLQRLPQVEAAKVLPRDIGALARAFPVFLQFEVGSSRRPRARGDAVSERRRAFDALRELLARIADNKPVILFIDDLQWGDRDSEPLLYALFRPPDPPPLLLITSYRSEDAATAPLIGSLRKLAAGGIDVCDIPVGELAPDAAHELALTLLGPTADDARVNAIVREAYGSPLFLRQLAALVGTSESIDLSSALAKRVESLGVDARRLLETLAVSGKPLPLAVAARAAGIEQDPQGVLASLRAETLVRTRGVEARDEVEVYHERIREAVVRSLSADQQQQLHKKLAIVLSSSGGDFEELAVHFRAGGESSLAAEYAEKAADRAAGALAFARAAEMYEMALDLVNSSQSQSPASVTQGDVTLKLADALVSAGRGQDAAARFLDAAKRPSVSSLDAMELRRRAAEQLLFSGRIEDGMRVVDQILQAMKMRVPKTRLGAVVSLLWRRLVLRLRGLRFRERSEDALTRDRLVRIDTCYSLGLGLGMIDPIRGADFQTRYLLLALGAGERVRIAKGMALEAAYRAADGSPALPAITALLKKAKALSDRVGQPHAMALTTLMSGVASVILGDFPKGVELCDQAATELRERCTGVAWELDNAAFFAGFALVACGRIRELSERLPTLLEDAHGRGDLYGEVLLRLQCAWFVHLANDEPLEANECLSVITDEWSRGAFLLQHAWQMVNRVEMLLYMGECEKALAIIEETRPKLERSMFLRAETMRVRVANVIARAELAAAAEAKDDATRKAHLAQASAQASVLTRERWALTKGFRLLIEAGILALSTPSSSGTQAAGARYEEAIAELEARGARLYAMAARRRLGELLGRQKSEKSDALVATSVKEMTGERIRDPEKMARVFAPAVTVVASAPARVSALKARAPSSEDKRTKA